eukprot:TRINITY_DN36712_c0_g1_i1.p1 TRINITY_DN36712_c0_g1~~TRINITY_DN36712_c0_g1_i1.p1  ORF type:complete len:994 (+),score=196.72 TRINITY_DN36712_c0_g1_i1:24-3005(+)
MPGLPEMAGVLGRLAGLQALWGSMEGSGEVAAVASSPLEPELGNLERIELEAQDLGLQGRVPAQKVATLLLQRDEALLASYQQADDEARVAMVQDIFTSVRAAQKSLLASSPLSGDQDWESAGEATQIAMLRGALAPLHAHLPADVQEALDEEIKEVLQDFTQRRSELLAQASELQVSVRAAAEEEVRRLSAAIESSLSQVQGTSALRCGADGLYVPVDSPNHIWASAWLEPPASEPEHVDLLLCADVSGSMAPRLRALRATLCRIVDHMKPDDRLCAVTFNHAARVLMDWTLGHDEGKSRLQSAFQGLECSGGTRFSPALETIFAQIASTIGSAARESRQRPLKIIFLSDGESEEPSDLLCKQLLRRLAPLGASLCAIGYGSQSDAQLLRLLSQLGRGPFLYADSEESAAGAFGRLSAWAEECCGEGFAVVRSLGGCRVLEIEGGFCPEQLPVGPGTAVVLGPLLQGQVRSVAMKLELPAGLPQADLNAPLFECTFVLRHRDQVQLNRCTLRALQVPSLLVEGLSGIPVQVCLAEEYSSFDAVRQQKLVAALSDFWHLPPSAIAVDSVRSGSVILDARLLLPPGVAEPFLEALEPKGVEEALQSCGFTVSYVVVPGQRTARRVLQWMSADVMTELALRSGRHIVPYSSGHDEAVHQLKSLAEGQLGCMDPGTARGVLQDMEAAVLLDQEKRADAKHRLLQLQSAHLHSFPANPDEHVGLRVYDTPALRARAPVQLSARDHLGVVQDLVLVEQGYTSLDINFLGAYGGHASSYVVSAVEVLASSPEAGASRAWEVPSCADGGPVSLQLSGLQQGRAYLVSVTAKCSSSGQLGQPCPSKLMCTLCDVISWNLINLQSTTSTHVLTLEWAGQLHGPSWTVSLNQESAFRAQAGGVSISKTTLTSKPQWTATASLDSGIYRIDVEDEAAPEGTLLPTPALRGGRKASCRARCWICVGPSCDLESVITKLKAKYPSTVFCAYAEDVVIAQAERTWHQ